MTILICAAIAVVIATTIAVRWWTWRPLVKRRALVQLVDGTAFDGVIISRRGPLLVMADVTARIGDGQSIDGRVIIERRRVEWVQVMS